MLGLSPVQAMQDQDEGVVEELVIRGYNGPPWWKVSDDDTTLYILADPGSRLPLTFEFKQQELRKRLQGANVVLLPPGDPEPVSLGEPSADRMWILESRLRGEKQTNEDGKEFTMPLTLEPSLPPDIRRRFVAARQSIRQSELRYGTLSPALAGMVLAGDVLQERAPVRSIQKSTSLSNLVKDAAERRRVKIDQAPGQSPVNAMDYYVTESEKLGMSCLVSALDAIDDPVLVERRPLKEVEDAQREWAKGDVRPVLDSLRHAERGHSRVGWAPVQDHAIRLAVTQQCLAEMPGVVAARKGQVQSEVARLKGALAQPGHAVAVMDPLLLLKRGGVLDELQKQGFQIRTPDQS